jgi:hypothetical protein
MIKLITMIFLIIFSYSANGQEVEPVTPLDENYYIMIGAPVRIVEGISSTVDFEKQEVKTESKIVPIDNSIKDCANPSEGLSVSILGMFTY